MCELMKKFTLVELLVVLAVIGILASLLLPSLKDARMSSMSAVCKSNLKQTHIVSTVYSGDNDQYFMTWPSGNSDAKKKLWSKSYDSFSEKLFYAHS